MERWCPRLRVGLCGPPADKASPPLPASSHCALWPQGSLCVLNGLLWHSGSRRAACWGQCASPHRDDLCTFMASQLAG